MTGVDADAPIAAVPRVPGDERATVYTSRRVDDGVRQVEVTCPTVASGVLRHGGVDGEDHASDEERTDGRLLLR